MNSWNHLLILVIAAVILWLTCKAIIGAYFKAKVGFVDDLISKLKGTSNGKAE